MSCECGKLSKEQLEKTRKRAEKLKKNIQEAREELDVENKD